MLIVRARRPASPLDPPAARAENVADMSGDRRQFLKAALALPAAAFARSQQPAARLSAWMRVNNPLERYMNDYKRTFDAWEEGGVRAIAIGRMYFVEPDGALLPVFPADPKVYDSFGVAPPAPTPRNLEKEKLLRAMLDDMSRRGWEVLFFSNPRMGGSRPLADDPYQVIGFAAGVQDAIRAFPQVQRRNHRRPRRAPL